LHVKLNEAGTDYLGHGSFGEEEFTRHWQVLRGVLEDAPRKLARPEVARRWPADAEAPGAVTLWRWLERPVAQGLVLREGSGRKSAPYRYWLPGQEKRWSRPPGEAELARLAEHLNSLPDPLAHRPPGEPG
jgi:hypothetical protein